MMVEENILLKDDGLFPIIRLPIKSLFECVDLIFQMESIIHYNNIIIFKNFLCAQETKTITRQNNS